MSKVQVLVTTMHQTDCCSIAERMNVRGSILIANQADRYGYQCVERAEGNIEMVTTPTRGVSKNRNIALECAVSDTEYILFADDDVIFKDGYEEIIVNEFMRNPKAEAIKFNLYDVSETRKISMKRIDKFCKAKRRTVSSSGVCGVAIRKVTLVKNNLRFNEFFGPGTKHYCGEDTIFLQEMINKKVKLYLSPMYIAGIDQTESCWFEGYSEKFFYTSGMVIAAIYPKLAKLITVRSAYKFSKRKNCQLKFKKILSCYWKGIRAFLHGEEE